MQRTQSVTTVVRRRPYKKRAKVQVSTLARQIKQIRKSQELKWFDTTAQAPVSGTVLCLNLVPLGDDSVTRDGRKITMKSVMCRINGYISTPQGSNAPAAPRYLIVYDKVCNGVLPSVNDIMTSSSATSMPNLDFRDRFKILYDNYVGYGNNSANAVLSFPTNSPVGLQFQDVKYLKLKDLEAVYKDTGSGTIQGSNTGALYAVFLGGGQSTTGTETKFRIRFLDS